MLGLKARTANPSVEQPSETAHHEVLPLPGPEFGESLIPARSTIGWKRQLCFHLDQTGLQMSTGAQRGRRSKLLDARKMYFPADIASEQARTNFLTKSIGEYARKYGNRTTEAVVTVTGPETAFRTFVMPNLKPRDLASAVAFEAKKQIPFPPQDCEFDFRPVAHVNNAERTGLKVALHAATNRTIKERLEPFQKLNLQVDRIYHAQDILGQLLRYLPDFTESRHYTLVNVERTQTEISYYRGSNLEFYHICSVGSSFLARRSDPTVFEYFAEALAGEIQNSLDFYSGQYSGQFTTRIFIHGDLAYTDELIDLLHDRFGYEFKRFPTEDLRLSVSGGNQCLETMSACLPVLAAATCPTRLSNLLPKQEKSRIAQRAQHRLAVTALAALLGLLLTVWVSARMQTAVLEQRLQGLTTQVDNFKASSLFDTYGLLRHEITSGQSYLAKIEPVATYLSLNLKDLSRITPEPVTLFALTYLANDMERNFSLDGSVHSRQVPPEVILAEYIENLEASPFFSDVAVLRHTKRINDGVQVIDFHIGLRATI
jgi:Tfp pilus assembly PilM family ATPase